MKFCTAWLSLLARAGSSWGGPAFATQRSSCNSPLQEQAAEGKQARLRLFHVSCAIDIAPEAFGHCSQSGPDCLFQVPAVDRLAPHAAFTTKQRGPLILCQRRSWVALVHGLPRCVQVVQVPALTDQDLVAGINGLGGNLFVKPDLDDGLLGHIA